MKTIVLTFLVLTLTVLSFPAQARYADGMNLYAGYHAMHGGVDPMGTRRVGPAMDGGYESTNQASQMSAYDYNQKVKEDKRAAAAASDPAIAARHAREENRRLWSLPNSTITGPGLGRDFMEGIGPEKRFFKDGDYLTGVLQEHDDVKQARLESRVSAKIYCEGNYWEAGLPHGRIDTRPDNRDWNGFMYAFADIPSIFTGGLIGTQEDIAYLGTLHGIWRITSIDCDSCTATVKFKLGNKMGLKSGTYGALENIPQDPNQPRQPYATIEQEWEWHEETPFKKD